jgi:hypothetical protein
MILSPRLGGVAEVHFADNRKGLSVTRQLTWICPFARGAIAVDWSSLCLLAEGSGALATRPPERALYERLPSDAVEVKNYVRWQKQLTDFLFRNCRYGWWADLELGLYAEPGESERDFRIRIADQLHEARDQALEHLRARYAPKLESLDERMRRARERLEVATEASQGAGIDTALSLGAAVIDALLRRRRSSASLAGRASSTVRGAKRASRKKEDVRRAREAYDRLQIQRYDLEQRVEGECAALANRYRSVDRRLTRLELKPRKSDVRVVELALAWIAVDAKGTPCLRLLGPGTLSDLGELVPAVS